MPLASPAHIEVRQLFHWNTHRTFLPCIRLELSIAAAAAHFWFIHRAGRSRSRTLLDNPRCAGVFTF